MFYPVARLQGPGGRDHLYSELAQHTGALWQGCETALRGHDAPGRPALPWGRGTSCKPPHPREQSPCCVTGTWTVTRDTQAGWPRCPPYLGPWQQPRSCLATSSPALHPTRSNYSRARIS